MFQIKFTNENITKFGKDNLIGAFNFKEILIYGDKKVKVFLYIELFPLLFYTYITCEMYWFQKKEIEVHIFFVITKKYADTRANISAFVVRA
jgi:hypothetical protein